MYLCHLLWPPGLAMIRRQMRGTVRPADSTLKAKLKLPIFYHWVSNLLLGPLCPLLLHDSRKQERVPVTQKVARGGDLEELAQRHGHVQLLHDLVEGLEVDGSRLYAGSPLF